jgi:hypothetical protein
VTSQLPLFDGMPEHCLPARNTDPATSHIAAEEVSQKLSHCQRTFVAALAALGSPATAYEIATAANARDPSSSVETYRKRATECVRAERIKDYGRRECRVTGKQATTYALPGSP